MGEWVRLVVLAGWLSPSHSHPIPSHQVDVHIPWLFENLRSSYRPGRLQPLPRYDGISTSWVNMR